MCDVSPRFVDDVAAFAMKRKVAVTATAAVEPTRDGISLDFA